jgi:hypothetical protein
VALKLDGITELARAIPDSVLEFVMPRQLEEWKFPTNLPQQRRYQAESSDDAWRAAFTQLPYLPQAAAWMAASQLFFRDPSKTLCSLRKWEEFPGKSLVAYIIFLCYQYQTISKILRCI